MPKPCYCIMHHVPLGSLSRGVVIREIATKQSWMIDLVLDPVRWVNPISSWIGRRKASPSCIRGPMKP